MKPNVSVRIFSAVALTLLIATGSTRAHAQQADWQKVDETLGRRKWSSPAHASIKLKRNVSSLSP